jgi:hypothetical protein
MAIAVGAYLVGFGLLMGVAVDRMRFDRQRSEVLGRYAEALREWQAYRMAFEKDAETRRQPLAADVARLTDGGPGARSLPTRGQPVLRVA